MNFITDNSRLDAGYSQEKNDCVVRALANATGKNYVEVRELFRLFGRKERRGMKGPHYRPVYEFFSKGHIYAQPRQSFGTVNSFIAMHPVGTFIVKISGHVFTLKDGKIIDTCCNYQNCRVIAVWWF